MQQLNLMYRNFNVEILQSLLSFRMTARRKCHSERSEESNLSQIEKNNIEQLINPIL